MEAYVLDDKLRRVQCVDLFNSFIWAERYSERGDFVLKLDISNPARKLFKKGTKLVIKNSFKVATVDTIERDLDADGSEVVKITGYTDEHILTKRLAKKNHDNLELNPNWEITGTPRDILKKMVYDICLDGKLDVKDKIPYLVQGDLISAPGTWLALPELLYWNAAVGVWETAYTSNTIPDILTDPITINAKPQSLYKTVKEICDVYGLGFRLVRNFDNSELYFEIYTGQDRTSLQTFYPAIRFSVETGNLVSSSEIDTDKDAYNVAYVYSKKGSVIVYPDEDSVTTATGFNRSVLYVEVTDYEEEQTPADHQRLLKQRGLEELAKHRSSIAFDGEISKSSNYKYGIDYNLGDFVELKNADGLVTKMLVSEQIFVHDLEGERSYPTLTNVETISTSSWAGQSPILYWSMAEGYWATWTS